MRSTVKITREIYEEAPGPSKCVSRSQAYVGTGMRRMETRTVTSESDYDNGEVFYSPATISRFFRSSRTGKAYWFGNITGPEAYGNSPRYPLVMAEVDEQTGFLLKETLTVIDDRDSATEAEGLQLSNFSLLEDRESGKIELYMTKLGADVEDKWRSNAFRYFIEPDPS